MTAIAHDQVMYSSELDVTALYVALGIYYLEFSLQQFLGGIASVCMQSR